MTVLQPEGPQSVPPEPARDVDVVLRFPDLYVAGEDVVVIDTQIDRALSPIEERAIARIAPRGLSETHGINLRWTVGLVEDRFIERVASILRNTHSTAQEMVLAAEDARRQAEAAERRWKEQIQRGTWG